MNLCCKRGYAAATGSLAVQRFDILYELRQNSSSYPLPAWIFGPLALGALALLLAEESRKFIVNRFNKRRAGGVMQRAVHHDR